MTWNLMIGVLDISMFVGTLESGKKKISLSPIKCNHIVLI